MSALKLFPWKENNSDNHKETSADITDNANLADAKSKEISADVKSADVKSADVKSKEISNDTSAEVKKYTMKEVADILGVPLRTAYRITERGELKTDESEPIMMITDDALMDYLDRKEKGLKLNIHNYKPRYKKYSRRQNKPADNKDASDNNDKNNSVNAMDSILKKSMEYNNKAEELFNQKYYTVKEVAVMMGVSINTVRNLIKDNKLDYISIGGVYRIILNEDFNLKYYTVKEIEDIFRIDNSTICRYISDGKLIACKIGGTYRISSKALCDFIESSARGNVK